MCLVIESLRNRWTITQLRDCVKGKCVTAESETYCSFCISDLRVVGGVRWTFFSTHVGVLVVAAPASASAAAVDAAAAAAAVVVVVIVVLSFELFILSDLKP